MRFHQLTKSQQNAARRITEKLWDAGVAAATTSNVARHLDDVTEWDAGRLTLEKLCERVGWDAPAATDEATAVQKPVSSLDAAAGAALESMRSGVGAALEAALDRLDEAIAARVAAETVFRADLAAARDAGIAVNEIARRTTAAGIGSKMTVLRLLGAETVRESAAAAVRATGYGQEISLDVRRGGRVVVRLDGADATERLRVAHALEVQLRAAGLYLAAGGDSPALTPCEDLADGETLEILKD